MSVIASIVVSALFTWLVAMHFYRRQASEPPAWALEWVRSLPQEKPSLFELIGLVQKALDDGRLKVHPANSNLLACPECGTPSQDFQDRVYGDDHVTVVSVTCPGCGWNESYEI